MPRVIGLLLVLISLSISPFAESKVKTVKRLPKKIKVPEGYIPVDPSVVDVNDKLYSSAEIKLQEALLKDEKFQGVVQFVRGEVLWADANRQPDPVFKSILRKGDALKLGQDSFVKIITQKRCIGVVYGPTTLTTGVSKEDDVWQVDESTVRWICPGKSEERLQIGKKALSLFSSEILYYKNKLLVLNGEPSGENGNLDPHKLYVGKGSSWRLVKNQPHIYDLWLMNKEVPIPKESEPWAEPDKKATYRLSVGPQVGGGSFSYGDSNIQDAVPSDLRGFRLTGYFHRDKKVYFLSMNSTERETGPRSSSGGYNYSASYKADVINFGIRNNPENNFSYIARFGVGGSELRPAYDNGSSFYSHNVELTVLQLGFGADYIVQVPGWKWLGFVLTGEVQVTKSIGSPRFKGNYTPSAGDPLYSALQSNGFSTFEVLVHAAPLIYF
jgi:hypothetical protein